MFPGAPRDQAGNAGQNPYTHEAEERTEIKIYLLIVRIRIIQYLK